MAALPLRLKLVLRMLRGTQRFSRRGIIDKIDKSVAPLLARHRVVDVHGVEHLTILK